MDTQDALRDVLILKVLHGCSFGETKYVFPILPWGSQWTFAYDERNDDGSDHNRLSVTATTPFAVPTLPTLADTLLSREEFEELVKAFGREGAYEFTRFDVFARLALPIQGNVTEGQFERWTDSRSGSSGNNSWNCAGVPLKTLPVRYSLTLGWSITNNYGVDLV